MPMSTFAIIQSLLQHCKSWDLHLATVSNYWDIYCKHCFPNYVLLYENKQEPTCHNKVTVGSRIHIVLQKIDGTDFNIVWTLHNIAYY